MSDTLAPEPTPDWPELRAAIAEEAPGLVLALDFESREEEGDLVLGLSYVLTGTFTVTEATMAAHAAVVVPGLTQDLVAGVREEAARALGLDHLVRRHVRDALDRIMLDTLQHADGAAHRYIADALARVERGEL